MKHRKDWRAFEVRAIIPFPADWDEDRVEKKLRDYIEFFDKGLIEAIEKAFPDSTSRQSLINALQDSSITKSGWGEFQSKIDKPPILGLDEPTETEEVQITLPAAEAAAKLMEVSEKISTARKTMYELKPTAYPEYFKSIYGEEELSPEEAEELAEDLATKEAEDFATSRIAFRSQRARLGAHTRTKKRISKQTRLRDIEVVTIDKTGRYQSQFPDSIKNRPARRVSTFLWEIPFDE